MKSTATIKTLVIGGAGYIGAHLVPQLIATGRHVTVLGRSLTPRYELPNEATYISGDFGQRDLIGSLLANHQEGIHLAYATVPNTSFDNPLADLLENLPPTVQLFSEAAERGTKLILMSSGGTVYGEANELPILETHPTKPISPYGVTKLTLENYAYLYAVTHGLKFVCIRPGNAYGAGQRPFVGQGFISTALASAMTGKPIRIFGQQGTIRDYLYVSDLASGIVSALQHGQLTETYNIGSGVGLSNLDVIEAIKVLLKEVGCSVKVENLPARAFDVKTNVLDSTKLETHTGWRPKVEFEEGLARTYDWLKAMEK
ncbi:NAD-dependent epimerase/dehydratase family protein [Sideroxydans lithotrophicus]|uniref:NAD-dependent epimerase/dehydratase n=1 Tax=Sideroxydans lithotrophicus (strain ES-1) TaxID=580332 RepID=D5CQ92_SIDLE|nr:NAD-dependent epimerase/dehydratase family protein [Sideroxydans lithotrophicus]ADE13113.1 NAD-dependent epimerase/dehydratase [Sideroxydans lithotrophicus ES-1]